MNWEKPILIEGACHHNLKNISLKIPREALVVITGVSGSGKSTLAYDIIYAEGQRKYVESLSAYARQFLERLQKPEVDEIYNLSPTIAIEQRKSGYTPRSTVGTITEIYDYLRLLFARAGTAYCPDCNVEIKTSSTDEIVNSLLKEWKDEKVRILAPFIRGKKGEFKSEFQNLLKQGFVKFRVDGVIHNGIDNISLNKNKKHTVEILIDILTIKEEEKNRLFESVELALQVSKGLILAETTDGKKSKMWSEKYACPECGFTFPEISPRSFSFNSPYGACDTCDGLGVSNFFVEEMIIPDGDLSLREGAVLPIRGKIRGYYTQMFECLAEHYNFDINTPYKNLPPRLKNIILYGSGDEEIEFYIKSDRSFYFTKPFEGIIPMLERKYKETENYIEKEELEKFMTMVPCPECGGARLKKEYLSVKIGGKNIYELSSMSIQDLKKFFDRLSLAGSKKIISGKIVEEVKRRLSFMTDVGLDYLSLDRTVATLSGGEYQRTKLATQLGSGLVGVIYVIDEPSIGLHPRDTDKMIDKLIDLSKNGNTVLVVEHDPDTIKKADWIIDLGPMAGNNGGEVVAEGTLEKILKSEKSLTGRYLKGTLKIDIPSRRRHPIGEIVLKECSQNNLKNIDVKIPTGVFICVTGVSGSGKSSLIMDTLYPALKSHLTLTRIPILTGKYSKIYYTPDVNNVIVVDQKPIGKTSRSNPATYIGAFTPIRQVFASTREARMRGYQPGRFSFNIKGGRCESCSGEGVLRIDMQFLPDVFITCDVCEGKRFNSETLEVKFKGKTIYDVLELSIEDALKLFENIPVIRKKLSFLVDVGLGYLKLGQPAPTLSGGESQRIKLARELTKKEKGGTVYILDEPTIGLHMHDINNLLKVLNKLVDRGNTVIVIEHNLDVIKCADWIIDLGPEGGERGGEIVACGTPEEISKNKNSLTGKYLSSYMRGNKLKKSAGAN